MEKTKGEMMSEVVARLEDVQRSQVAVIEKLAHVQVHLIDLPDKELEDGVVDLHSSVSNQVAAFKEVIDQYTMKVNVINQEERPAAANSGGE